MKSPRATALLIAIGLVLGIGVAFNGVGGFDFVTLDDASHVYRNPLVEAGLNWPGVWSAFTEAHASLWVPLTMISFMADRTLFGFAPGAYHLENVAWHAGAAVLLFLALWRMTGRLGPAALVAALFGLHPINVESVAWVTERKNVLCGFFTMLTLWCWAHYIQRSRPWILAGAVVAYALAILAKPMAVPLPAALLLLDFWPLRRWGVVPARRLILEKLPFFLLAFIGSRMAVWATTPFDSMASFEQLSFSSRLTNALAAYLGYLRQLFVPRDFSVFYPHTIVSNWGLICGGLALLLAITFLAWRLRQTQPWLLTGWLFFLGLVVPSLGFIQVGQQGRADRFVYLAEIGVFAAVVWSADYLWPVRARRLQVPVACALLAVLGWLTMQQTKIWTDSITLFRNAVAVSNSHSYTLELLGTAHAADGNDHAAVYCWREALLRAPENASTWNSMGAAFMRLGRPADAQECFRRAAELKPDLPSSAPLPVR